MPRSRSDFRAVQCGGTDTTGLVHADPRAHRAASSGASLPGASKRRYRVRRSSRTVLRVPSGALVGVQPTTRFTPRPGARARRRRSAARPCLYGAQASSVRAKRVLTTPGNVTSHKVEVLVFRTNGRLTRLFSAGSEGRNLPSKRSANEEVDPTLERCPSGTPSVSPTAGKRVLIRPFKHLQPPRRTCRFGPFSLT